MQVTTVGLDLAKRIFQVHGVDAAGKVVIRRKLQRIRDRRLLRRSSGLPGGDRSMRYRTSLGPANRSIWPSGAADPPVLRQTLCSSQQDRCCRCRGDLRGGRATEHAFRTGEVRASTSRAFASSSARPIGSATNHADQRNPRSPRRPLPSTRRPPGADP